MASSKGRVKIHTGSGDALGKESKQEQKHRDVKIPIKGGAAMASDGGLDSPLNENWKEYYIDRDALENQLLSLRFFNGEKDFVDMLTEQINKCNQFYQDNIKHLMLKNYPVSDDKIPVAVKAVVLQQDVLKLEEFVKDNILTLVEIIESHDEQSKHPLASSFQWKFDRQGFCSPKLLEPLLLRLSDQYCEIRESSPKPDSKNEDSDEEGKPKGVASTVFERTSIKFWVRNADVTKVICRIIKYLPVFSHGKARNFSQAITSIYYDDEKLSMYSKRLVKEEGSDLVRFRWYGDLTEDSLVFIERKVHHEDWVMENSSKTRCALPQEHILGFIQGSYRPTAEFRDQHPVFSAVQETVINQNLQPMIQTKYNRSAYQLASDDSVRISIDADLKMIRESPCDTSRHWHRPPESFLESDVHHFPFAVLEVKLHNHLLYHPPAWVDDLMNSDLLIRVDKFSKYGHGTAVLYNDMVEMLPYWLDGEFIVGGNQEDAKPSPEAHEPNTHLQTPATQAARKNTISLYDKHVQDLIMNSPGTVSGSGDPNSNSSRRFFLMCIPCFWPALCSKKKAALSKTKKKVAKPMRIEPKTFFANERTYLQWFNAASLIGSVSLAMLGMTGTTRMIGLFLIPVALMIVAYALLVYHWRTIKLQRRDAATTFADRWGPTGLTATFIIVMALSVIYSSTVSVDEEAKGEELSIVMESKCDISRRVNFPVPPEQALIPSAVAAASKARVFVGSKNGRISVVDMQASTSVTYPTLLAQEEEVEISDLSVAPVEREGSSSPHRLFVSSALSTSIYEMAFDDDVDSSVPNSSSPEPLSPTSSWKGGRILTKHMIQFPDDIFSTSYISALCFIPVEGEFQGQEVIPFGPGEANPIPVNTNNVPSGADPDSVQEESDPASAISAYSEGGVFHIARFPGGEVYTYVLPLKGDLSSEPVLVDRIGFLPLRKDMVITALTLRGTRKDDSMYHHVFAAVADRDLVLSYTVSKNTGLPYNMFDIESLAVVKLSGLSILPSPASGTDGDEEVGLIASSREGRVIQLRHTEAGFSYCPEAAK